MNFFSKYTDDRHPDYKLLYISSALFFVGLVFSYSLSIFTVDYFDYTQYHFFIRQLFSVVIAVFIMWSFAHIKPEILFTKWRVPGWIFLAFSLIMIAMPILPQSWVTESGGATRWIKLPGISISPVEFFKIGFIFVISSFLYRKKIKLDKTTTIIEEVLAILPTLIILGFFSIFIGVAQKDLGNTVLLTFILLALYLFSDRSYKLILGILGSGVAGFFLLIAIAPHRIDRIRSWWGSVQDSVLSPFSETIRDAFHIEEFSEAYQVKNSIHAIYNGGWFGTGLGEGNLKLGFLGEVHTDFVLAGITEEIGILGLIVLLTTVIYVIARIFRIAWGVDNELYHYFCVGVAIMISFSFLINSYGITGMIPIKGLAVPFLSYGGSSVIALGIAIGLVLSISKEVRNE